MPEKQQRRLMLTALSFIAVVCCGLWFLRTNYLYVTLDYQQVYSQNGVWDLTGVDFSSGYVRLIGEGETIVNALYTPAEFALHEGEARFGGYGDAPVNTTRLRILLPDDGLYTVVGLSVDYAERIYINGQWRQDVGSVALRVEDFEPASAYLNLETRAEDKRLEILRQSSNLTHWMLRNPVNLTVGSSDIMRRVVSMETDQAGLVMGMFFALFLSHGLLYLILQRYRANLYFSLLCLAWSLRFGVTDVMPIPAWFPGVSWYIYLRMEYALVAAASVTLVLVVQEIFPAALPPRLRRVIFAYSGLWTAVSVFVPPKPLTYLWIPCAVVYTALILTSVAYLIRYMAPKIRSHTVRAEQWMMSLSLLFLFFTVIQDAVYSSGLFGFGILNDLGFLVFGFFQMAANLYGTMREVENAHKLEQEAETVKRVGALKEQFLHNLSHELQVPLTVVSGFAQFTAEMIQEDEAPQRDVIADNMRRVIEESGRMERMVAQLLDTASMESKSFVLHCEKVDLCALLHDAAGIHFPVMDGKSNRIAIEAPEELFVYGDRERLLQVILNLLSNAVRYTENGTISLHSARKESMVQVSVSDTGTGIEPELLPRLFGRYVRDETGGGTGLGLYVSMKIVEAHGGKISVANRPEGGAVIRFSVPCWKEESENG